MIESSRALLNSFITAQVITNLDLAAQAKVGARLPSRPGGGEYDQSRLQHEPGAAAGRAGHPQVSADSDLQAPFPLIDKKDMIASTALMLSNGRDQKRGARLSSKKTMGNVNTANLCLSQHAFEILPTTRFLRLTQ